MKVALVYDRINKWGGAERILLALYEMWPDAPLYTAVYNPATAPWAKVFNVRPAFVQKIPFAKTNHEWFPWLMPLGFEAIDFDQYEVVITVTSAEAKGIITKPKTLHICYCLTPARYLWSHKDLYINSRGNLFKTLASPVFFYLRAWDQIAAARPDHYVTISKAVQRRAEKYYQRESEVIYPPVDVKCEVVSEKWDNSLPAQYYLIVSRLVSYKRVDLAIKACNELKFPLVIVGDGSERNRLQKIAGDNIKFVPGLTDRQLLRYYQQCRALIMPQEEDFGLVAVEAQACGKPVVAYRRGGALETVLEGITGEFFAEQTVESLITALKKFDPRRYDSKNCLENANKFNKERFKREFKEYVEEKYEQFRVTRNT